MEYERHILELVEPAIDIERDSVLAWRCEKAGVADPRDNDWSRRQPTSDLPPKEPRDRRELPVTIKWAGRDMTKNAKQRHVGASAGRNVEAVSLLELTKHQCRAPATRRTRRICRLAWRSMCWGTGANERTGPE